MAIGPGEFLDSLRQLRKGCVSDETPCFLMSRDGETLRSIIEIGDPTHIYSYKKRGRVVDRLANLTLRGQAEFSTSTATFGEIFEAARRWAEKAESLAAAPEVAILADGFGRANWARLESIRLATDVGTILSGLVSETSLIFSS